MTEEEARACVHEVERILHEYTYGWANTDAVRAIQAPLQRLRAGLPDAGGVRNKIGELESWIPILYSPRKHVRWEKAGRSGADEVRSFILNDCSGLRMAIAHHFAVQRRDQV